MKKLLLLVSLFQAAWTSNIQAQLLQVIASSGGICQKDDINMTWTMGETAVLTMSSGDLMFTAGFLQPVLIVSSIGPDDGVSFEIRAFPNPTDGCVEVELKKSLTRNIIFSLYDAGGRKLLHIHPENSKTRIDLGSYANGLYLLKVLQAEKEITTFEIIKQK
jgi:hypothetical protein